MQFIREKGTADAVFIMKALVKESLLKGNSGVYVLLRAETGPSVQIGMLDEPNPIQGKPTGRRNREREHRGKSGNWWENGTRGRGEVWS